jgi:hypothetical protein
MSSKELRYIALDFDTEMRYRHCTFTSATYPRGVCSQGMRHLWLTYPRNIVQDIFERLLNREQFRTHVLHNGVYDWLLLGSSCVSLLSAMMVDYQMQQTDLNKKNAGPAPLFMRRAAWYQYCIEGYKAMRTAPP